MKIYFDTDYDVPQEAVDSPILVDGRPIGFIKSVEDKRHVCGEIFGQFIHRMSAAVEIDHWEKNWEEKETIFVPTFELLVHPNTYAV